MPKDEWKDVYSSLSKDIEELRKELLTERVKNLPEMVKGMVTTARQDMEVRIKEIQENVREERRLVDEKVTELDTRMKGIDTLISTIQANEARIAKFVETYGGELAEVKGDLKKVGDSLKSFEGGTKVKMSDLTAKVEKVGALDTALKTSLKVKREWSKVLSKWEKIEGKLDKLMNEFKEIKTSHKVMNSHVDELDGLFKNIIKSFGRMEEKMAETDKSMDVINASADTINELKGYITRLSEIFQKVGLIEGKLSELEEYYRNPEKWFSERIDRFLNQKLMRMEKDLESINGFVKKNRDYSKQDFLQTMLVAKLTEIANSESWENVLVNVRSLEFIVSEMERSGYWSSTTKNSVVESLAGTRDFWEARNPEVSEAIQDGIDRVEKI